MDMGVKRAVLLAAALGLAPEDILFPKGYERPEHKQAERIRVRAEKLRDRKSEEAVRKRA